MNVLNELLFSARLALFAGTRFIFMAAIAFFCFFVVVLSVLRFVDPPTSAVMLRNYMLGARVQYQWTPMEQISVNLVRAVIISEDARFCSHLGVDLREIANAMETANRRGIDAVRGASTITMQVVKNLFLWTDRSFARKGLELAITPIMELIWPKRRILEVYLNIAQWAPGLFGVGAAARHHFGRAPIDLTLTEASLLTAALPAPSRRRAGRANALTRRIAARVRRRMRPANVTIACVLR